MPDCSVMLHTVHNAYGFIQVMVNMPQLSMVIDIVSPAVIYIAPSILNDNLAS